MQGEACEEHVSAENTATEAMLNTKKKKAVKGEAAMAKLQTLMLKMKTAGMKMKSKSAAAMAKLQAVMPKMSNLSKRMSCANENNYVKYFVPLGRRRIARRRAGGLSADQIATREGGHLDSFAGQLFRSLRPKFKPIFGR